MLLPIAAALYAAHRRGLVHRDIKPANVLVARDEDGAEHPYLTDFGIARRIDATMAGDVTLTQTGMMIGTVDFMAPELVRGERGDARSDVYSFGCMLFEALAGRVPFPRDYEVAKLQAHVAGPAAFTRRGPSRAVPGARRGRAARHGQAAGGPLPDRGRPRPRLPGRGGRAVAGRRADGARRRADQARRCADRARGPAPSPAEVTGPTEPLEPGEPTGPTAAATPPLPPAPPPPAPPSRRRRTAPILAGLGVLALAGVALALALGGGGGDGGSSGDGGSTGDGGSSSPSLVAASTSDFTIQAPEGWGRTDTALTKSIQRTEWTSDTDAGASVLVDALPGSATPTEQRARNTRANTSQRSGYEELGLRGDDDRGRTTHGSGATPSRAAARSWTGSSTSAATASRSRARRRNRSSTRSSRRTEQVAESLRSNSC